MRPVEGIRVLEVAMYGFVPSAGAVLAEWGADVVKVEHPVTGDPQRGLRQTGMLRVEGDPNPNIEHANRGKRSLGLDMSVPEGTEVLYGLARRSDVFLTSFLPGTRQKFGIDVFDFNAFRLLTFGELESEPVGCRPIIGAIFNLRFQSREHRRLARAVAAADIDASGGIGKRERDRVLQG